MIHRHSNYETNMFQGLHPRLITEGFEVAKKKALEVSFLCECCCSLLQLSHHEQLLRDHD